MESPVAWEIDANKTRWSWFSLKFVGSHTGDTGVQLFSITKFTKLVFESSTVGHVIAKSVWNEHNFEFGIMSVPASMNI